MKISMKLFVESYWLFVSFGKFVNPVCSLKVNRDITIWWDCNFKILKSYKRVRYFSRAQIFLKAAVDEN